MDCFVTGTCLERILDANINLVQRQVDVANEVNSCCLQSLIVDLLAQLQRLCQGCLGLSPLSIAQAMEVDLSRGE